MATGSEMIKSKYVPMAQATSTMPTFDGQSSRSNGFINLRFNLKPKKKMFNHGYASTFGWSRADPAKIPYASQPRSVYSAPSLPRPSPRPMSSAGKDILISQLRSELSVLKQRQTMRQSLPQSMSSPTNSYLFDEVKTSARYQ